MTELFTLANFFGLVAFSGLVVTVWKIRRDDWQTINKKWESHAIELAAFKILVLERHPTVADLAHAEQRFMDANRETLEAIRHLTARIDRLLELK